MKTKIIFLLWSIIFGSASITAQHIVTHEANHPRQGDILNLREVEYPDPGKSGKNIVWNFSRLIPLKREKGIFNKPLDDNFAYKDITPYLQIISSDEFVVSYHSGDDGRLIRGLEYGFINTYNNGGDSLAIWEMEWPSTRMEYNLPQTLLTYPFSYKAKITNYFSAYGLCYGIGIKLVGSIETEADAFGTLILPGNDTLRNVLRISTIKTELEEVERSFEKKNGKDWKVKGDSIAALLKLNKKELSTTEIIRWYAEGYRYPVLELRYQYTNLGGNKKKDEICKAYYYGPMQQEADYLSRDAINKSIISRNEHSASKASVPQQTVNINETTPLKYRIYPNPTSDDLTVELTLEVEASVSIKLYSMSGSLIYQSELNNPSGHSTKRIPMLSHPQGEYFLYISCGETTITEKIIKK